MFQGTLTALITPFIDSVERPIDWDSWESLVEWQISAGIDGLVIFGTTGESATLTTPEKIELTRRTLKQVNGRVPVIAGAGSNSTAASIELGNALRELEIDGILAVAPYYNKPTQEGLYQHFMAIADNVALPVVLYNVPSRTSVSIAPETVGRLARHPHIVAIKQAVDSVSEMLEMVVQLEGNALLLAGDDPLVYSVLTMGGVGVISASASVIPEQMCAITRAGLSGNWEAALRAQLAVLPCIKAFFRETNPAPAKAALCMMGKISSDCLRLPLVPVTETTRNVIREALALEQ